MVLVYLEMVYQVAERGSGNDVERWLGHLVGGRDRESTLLTDTAGLRLEIRRYFGGSLYNGCCLADSFIVCIDEVILTGCHFSYCAGLLLHQLVLRWMPMRREPT